MILLSINPPSSFTIPRKIMIGNKYVYQMWLPILIMNCKVQFAVMRPTDGVGYINKEKPATAYGFTFQILYLKLSFQSELVSPERYYLPSKRKVFTCNAARCNRAYYVEEIKYVHKKRGKSLPLLPPFPSTQSYAPSMFVTSLVLILKGLNIVTLTKKFALN